MEVGGYKGAMSSPGAMASRRMSAPVNCVLDKDMIVKGSEVGAIDLADLGPAVVETELGYIMGVDIATHIADPEEARLASEAVVAALDVTTSMTARIPGLSAVDFAAANCGSNAKIIIGERFHPDDHKVNELAISLSHNGRKVHDTNGGVSKGGQWVNLMTLINQIIDQGHTIRQGDLIISGVLGAPMPAEPGNYTADYGELGKVEFMLQ